MKAYFQGIRCLVRRALECAYQMKANSRVQECVLLGVWRTTDGRSRPGEKE